MSHGPRALIPKLTNNSLILITNIELMLPTDGVRTLRLSPLLQIFHILKMALLQILVLLFLQTIEHLNWPLNIPRCQLLHIVNVSI